MKMLPAATIAAMALGLTLSGTAAYAADYPGRGNQDATTSQQGDQNDRDHKGNKKPAKVETKPAPTAAPVVRGNQANDRLRSRPINNRNARNRRGTDDQTNSNLRPINQNDQNANDNRRNNPNWSDNNNNRRHLDMARWHRNFDAPRRYRANAYLAPRDYHYRRWGYGQRLPRDYYARNYWLMDFVMFGLLSPPDGYVWVRYGPDALLIDEETGEIIQVEYNVFYS